MDLRFGNSVVFDFATVNASGLPQDADALPSVALRVAGASDGTTVTVTNIGTGRYKAAFTAPAAGVSWSEDDYVVAWITGDMDGDPFATPINLGAMRKRYLTPTTENRELTVESGGSGRAVGDTAATLATSNTVAQIVSGIGTVGNLGSGTTLADNLADMAGATFATATDSLEAQRDNVGTAGSGLSAVGGSSRPVNQTPVPPARTWKLKVTDDGLLSEESITLSIDAGAKLCAADYGIVLANNGRLTAVTAAAIKTGTAGGVTFGADLNVTTDYGVDRHEAKVMITPVTAGDYTLRITCSIEGAGTESGDVELTVVA